MDPQRFRVRPNGLSTNGGATTADGSTYTAPSVTLTLPTHLGAAPFQRMITWRHVAMVFDATPDSIRGYLCVHEKHVHPAVTLPWLLPLCTRRCFRRRDRKSLNALVQRRHYHLCVNFANAGQLLAFSCVSQP